MIPLRVDIRRTRVAIISGLLILANVLAFLYELSLSPRANQVLAYTFGVVPARTELLFAGYGAGHGAGLGQIALPFVTSMFLHAGWMHLLGNMLFLWVFGGSVEEALGHFSFLLFYFVAGIGSALVHTIANWGSRIPTVGASGAISGVMGAFIVLFPRARVTTLIPALLLFFTVRIPAIFMLGYWFLIQFFSAVTSANGPSQGGVAWWAHVGGFLLGALLVAVMRPQTRVAV